LFRTAAFHRVLADTVLFVSAKAQKFGTIVVGANEFGRVAVFVATTGHRARAGLDLILGNRFADTVRLAVEIALLWVSLGRVRTFET
jgi:hypothetical protein